MSHDTTPGRYDDDITIEELDEIAGGSVASVACITSVACPVSTMGSLQPEAAE